jgi:hypothetical protein
MKFRGQFFEGYQAETLSRRWLGITLAIFLKQQHYDQFLLYVTAIN